jgi:hypothetical protein
MRSIYQGTPIRTKLNTIKQVKNEMAKVYREMRMGMIKTADGTRLVYVLGQMSALIRDHEIERRVEMLEKAQNEKFGSKNYPT